MTFDLEKFTINAIKIIDEIRATKQKPGETTGSVEKTESRISAFYRALGLPAFVTTGADLPKLNNGNVFDASAISASEITKSIVREVDFSTKLDEELVKNFLDYNEFDITDGIEVDGAPAKRVRGSLIPMFVNGNIPIYPQSSRVSEAFLKKDKKVSDNKYRRPLIELITLLRLRGRGISNTEINKAVRSDFFLLDSGLLGSTSVNIITAQVISNMLNAVLGIPIYVSNEIQKINETRTQIKTKFKDTIANIPSEQPISVKEEDLGGSVNKLKGEQQDLINRNRALTSLMEFDDTLTDGEDITRNMKDALLSSSVLNMIEVTADDTDKKIKESIDKEKKLIKTLKQSQQRLDIILGTFGGISGIDILLTITALFLIEEQFLLGLLNAETRDNLSKLKNDNKFDDVASVAESVKALQDKVIELYYTITGHKRWKRSLKTQKVFGVTNVV